MLVNAMQVNSAINFGVKPEKNPSKPFSVKISLIDDQTDLKRNNHIALLKKKETVLDLMLCCDQITGLYL